MKDLSFLQNKIIAHRGVNDNNKVVENTLESFSNAVKLGYAIEFDIHLLKDNEIVVYHDDNLKRLTGINKDLKDLTYDDIKDIKLLNTNQTIPKLSEVLKLVNGKVPLIIELKYDRKVGLLEKELVKYLDNYKGKFAVKSFNPLIVRWFKINRKDYIRGLLVPRNSKKLKKKIMSHMLLKPLCKPDFLSVDYRRNNKKLLKKSKIPIIVWTVKKDRSKFKELYGTIICDNLEGNKKC